MVPGGQVRTTTGLNLRAGPGAGHALVAVLSGQVLARVLTAPAAGWVQIQVNGWNSALDPCTIYSEPDSSSSTEAQRRGAAQWQPITLAGFVNASYLTVVDGP
jgi:uncharacterized protein YgiM (DUF1202 family)